MNEFISRQAMIDTMRRRRALFCKNRIEFMALPKDEKARVDEIDNCIADLVNAPSAEPERIIKIGQRSGKALESAINYLHNIGWLQEHDRILTESAEPKWKIIRCADCKWWDRLEEGHPYGDCRACRSGTQTERWDIHIQRQSKFDFYCADAEPKEDDDDDE